jgi:glycosyltransferase involved in cell wall biosynthesis
MTKSILIVSPVPTHPVTEGNIQRVHDLAVSLREMGYDPFFVFCPISGFVRTRDLSAFYEYWGDRCLVIPEVRIRSREFRVSWRQFLLNGEVRFQRLLGRPQWLTGLTPLMRSLFINQDTYCPKGLAEWVRDFCEREKPTAVLLEYFMFSQLAEAVPPGVRTVIDTHDVFSGRNERLRQTLGKDYYWHSITEKQECRALSRADVVIAIQAQEAAFFERMLGGLSQVEVVDFLAPTALAPAVSSSRKTLGFLASKNILNKNGFEWFLSNCWARVKEQVADAKLLVAGSICSVIDDDSIGKLGIVADVADFFLEVDVFVNPMLTGTGLKIKVVEAMRHGVAVVSTPIGAEGFEAAAPESLLIAEDAEAMVAHCVELLQDSVKLSQLRSGALNYYTANLQHSLKAFKCAIEGDVSR